MAERRAPRPGLEQIVDGKDGPTFISHGQGYRQFTFSEGTRVIHAPEPLFPLSNPDAAIRYALNNPVGDIEPLPALLHAGMKLTIAVHDASSPLPTMAQPDNRQQVLWEVLTMADRAGVEDVEIVVSRGLRRKATEAELRHILGDRVYNAFAPNGLIKQHDAEDPRNLMVVGTSRETGDVAINRRVAESDLLINVGVNTVGVDGGYSTVVNGLTGYETFRDSFFNKNATQSTATERLLAESGPRVFQIETTVNTNVFPENLAFLGKREWEWTLRDKAAFRVYKKVLEALPSEVERPIAHRFESPAQMTSVQAGEPNAVHEKTRLELSKQHLVEVLGGPSDILSMGLSDFSPYNVGSAMNPILVQALGLGYFFDKLGKGLVRKGGVVIMSHPTDRDFDKKRHLSYRDFFEQVLSETTDPFLILAKYLDDYANDPEYMKRYRDGEGFHGAHPFFTWLAGAYAARKHELSGVIVVGGHPAVVEHMGFTPASDHDDALELAKGFLGNNNPTVSHVHSPPAIEVKVI